MPIEVKINDSPDPKARYITYAPSPCQIRQTPAATALTVHCRAAPPAPAADEAVFYANRTVGAQPTPTLHLTLPADGTWVNFGLGGRPGTPSVDDLDCLLVASSAQREPDGAADGARPQERQQAESRRARPVSAGAGQAQHRAVARLRAPTRRCATCTCGSANGEEHFGPQFLPWHRAYLLDLERQLQAIDPSVSMHYWRFDEPAPNVFTKLFMGETKQSPEHGLLRGRSIREIRWSDGSPIRCPASFVRPPSTR